MNLVNGLALLLVLAPHKPPNTSIVGQWISAPDGATVRLEFRRDGTFTSEVGVIAKGHPFREIAKNVGTFKYDGKKVITLNITVAESYDPKGQLVKRNTKPRTEVGWFVVKDRVLKRLWPSGPDKGHEWNSYYLVTK